MIENPSPPDPVSMTSVIAVVIALLIIFLVLVISLLIAYKKQKLCFQGRNSDTQLADSHPPCCPSKFSRSLDPSNCYSSPLLLQGGLYLGFSVIRGKLLLQPNIISQLKLACHETSISSTTYSHLILF